MAERHVQQRDRDNYLKKFGARVRPWLNQCAACGHVGYKPEMPDRLGVSVLPHYVRRFFPLLALNERGICDQCVVSLRERTADPGGQQG